MRKNLNPFPKNAEECLRGFWNLPDLAEPPQSENIRNTKHIALIPLFSDAYKPIENIDAFMRAAIYSRWTCLQHTDAIEQGVEVKLYVEDLLRDRLEDVMLDNYIDPDKHVLWFNAPPLEKTEHGIHGYLGKQMYPYWDKRVAHYDRITVWDADLFFLPAAKTLFERFHKLPESQIGYIIAHKIPWEHLKIHWDLHFIADTKLGGVTRKRLLEMAGVPKFQGDVVFPLGCFWTYPAKYFHTHHPEVVKWISVYGPYFGNDQITATCWSYMFEMDIYSIYAEADIIVAVLEHALKQPDQTHIFHGVIPPDQEKAFHKMLEIT